MRERFQPEPELSQQSPRSIEFVTTPKSKEKPPIAHHESIDSLWKLIKSRRIFTHLGHRYRIYWIQPGPGMVDVSITKDEASHFHVDLPTNRRYVARTIASIFGWKITQEFAPLIPTAQEVPVLSTPNTEQVVYAAPDIDAMVEDAAASVAAHSLRIGRVE